MSLSSLMIPERRRHAGWQGNYALAANPGRVVHGDPERGVTPGDPEMKLSLYEPQQWPELLSPGQVAQLLQVAHTTVDRWCERGTIEAVKIGRVWRIPAEAVWPKVPPSIRARWGEGPWSEQGAPE